MKNIVVLTGAGISAESGLQTFRGNNGLWEGYRVEEVASPEAWQRNPEMVQRFYNMRRAACRKAMPNAAHIALKELEKKANVHIITQNIDDLHERAGSSHILHLHGEIMKAQSSKYPELVYDIEGDELHMGQLCEKGYQLRPHVVWFGEPVPNILKAMEIVSQADIFLIIGTSLQVYPAASLIHDTRPDCQVILIDPEAESFRVSNRVHLIAQKATVAVPKWVENFTE